MHANQKDYFLVHRTCLVTLLNQCRTCSSPSCTVNLFYTGTRITARTECPHAHVHTWSSQPLVGNKPRGNIYLTTALLFSGSSPTSALRMMRLMGVQVMSDQAFFNYQKAYLLPAVTMVNAQLPMTCSTFGTIHIYYKKHFYFRTWVAYALMLICTNE